MPTLEEDVAALLAAGKRIKIAKEKLAERLVAVAAQRDSGAVKLATAQQAVAQARAEAEAVAGELEGMVTG